MVENVARADEGAHETDQGQSTPLRRSIPRWLDVAVIGLVVAVLLSLAQILTAWYLDGRRGRETDLLTREIAWRQALADSRSPRLAGARLDGLNLSGAVGSRADLTGSSSVETNFEDGFFPDAKFDSGILTGASFAGALLTRSSFVGADLHGASFRGADLRSARFTLSKLDKASFLGANFEGADFRHTDLRSALFENIGKSSFCFDDETKFAEGMERPTLYCPDYPPSDLTSGTESRSMSLMVRVPGEAEGRWTDKLNLEDSQTDVEFRLGFFSEGTPSSDVKVVITNESGIITFSDVELVNSLNPGGVKYGAAAIPDGRSTVNVDIDSYLSGANAYVYVQGKIDRDEFECGSLHQLSVTAYVTPDLVPSNVRGALNSSATVIYEAAPC